MNKWVVESVTVEDPGTGWGHDANGNPTAVTTYTYGTPRWAASQSPVDGFTGTPGVTWDGYRGYWNTFHGHDTVTERRPMNDHALVLPRHEPRLRMGLRHVRRNRTAGRVRHQPELGH